MIIHMIFTYDIKADSTYFLGNVSLIYIFYLFDILCVFIQSLYYIYILGKLI